MFVLAHLSDPHLGPLPAARFAELSGKRALGYLNWHRSRRERHRPEVLAALVHDLKSAGADHIVVTGDLVNLGLRAEFAPARQWLSGLGAPHDVTVIPGNHDAYMRDALLHSADYWGDYMRGDGGGAGPERASRFPFVRHRGPVALIGLSTAVPTGPLLATGRLGPGQLQRLKSMLAGLGKDGRYRVVLIHHPPASARRQHFKRLTDDAAFRHVLAEHGAELVLHGHSHVHSLIWLEGPRGRIPVVGVPSASASPQADIDPAAYNLYRITHEAGGWRCEAIRRGLFAGAAGILELGRQELAD
jgi:3',5'-cyclic AMP phosphodiesterase CpdA